MTEDDGAKKNRPREDKRDRPREDKRYKPPKPVRKNANGAAVTRHRRAGFLARIAKTLRRLRG
jgi:hypothetical protein